MIYSVCTMTTAETVGIDGLVAQEHPDAVPIPTTDPRWRPRSRGTQLLPQDHNTDGMFISIYRTSGGQLG